MESSEIDDLSGRSFDPDAPTVLVELVNDRRDSGLPVPGESRSHRFGDYVVLDEIGRGGMGVVYRAYQSGLNRTVALKTIRPEPVSDDAAYQRFLREAAIAAALDHPNIVPVFDVGSHHGQHYFTMGFVSGPNLAQWMEDEPRSPQEWAELLMIVADAVHHAHLRGIIHRDLKPSNILIDEAGRPRITDFGLAKWHDSDSSLTLSGSPLGTPYYMAPEQAAGEGDSVGPWSDVYSLGVILYQLVTAELPFRGAPHMVIQQVLHETPRPPSRLNDRVPEDLEAICLKAMAREPSQRYQSAAELADDLRQFLKNGPVSARPATIWSGIGHWCRRQERIRDASTITVAMSTMLALWELQSLVFLFLGTLNVSNPARAALIIVGGMVFFSVLAGLGWIARSRTKSALWAGLTAAVLLLLFSIGCLAGLLQIEGLSETPVRIPVFGFFSIAALVTVAAHVVSLTAYYANRNSIRWTRAGIAASETAKARTTVRREVRPEDHDGRDAQRQDDLHSACDS